MKRFFALILCIIFFFSLSLNAFAFSDPVSLTISQLGAIAYGVASYSGLSFDFFNGTSSGAEHFMVSEIDKYCDGSSVGSVFSLFDYRYVAGKIAIGQLLYSEIKSFLTDFVSGLSDGDTVSEGNYNGVPIGDPYEQYGNYGAFSVYEVDSLSSGNTRTLGISVSANGRTAEYTWSYTPQEYGGTFNARNDGWTLVPKGQNFIVRNHMTLYKKDWVYWQDKITDSFAFPIDANDIQDKISVSFKDYDADTIDPGKYWQGDIGEAPDTNLDDLIQDIYDQVGLNDLDIEGEVIDDIIPPEPTPAPIDPDIPLSDVPWDGLNDLIGQSTKDVTDTLDDIKDVTQEGVQDIVQSLEGVQDGILDLTDTITDALSPPEIDEKTFDLTELFPFCIPFDIYHLLQKFEGTPTAPHVQLPIVIPSIGFSYTLDLDFSAWNPVAAAMRTVELIVYALGLAWATSKVIKW